MELLLAFGVEADLEAADAKPPAWATAAELLAQPMPANPTALALAPAVVRLMLALALSADKPMSLALAPLPAARPMALALAAALPMALAEQPMALALAATATADRGLAEALPPAKLAALAHLQLLPASRAACF